MDLDVTKTSARCNLLKIDVQQWRLHICNAPTEVEVAETREQEDCVPNVYMATVPKVKAATRPNTGVNRNSNASHEWTDEEAALTSDRVKISRPPAELRRLRRLSRWMG